MASSIEAGLIDSKVINKPKNFDGDADKWVEWSFTFKSYIAVVMQTKMSTAMTRTEQSTDVVDASTMTEDEKRMNVALFGILISVREKQAHTTLRQIENFNGLEAWRLLSRRFGSGQQTTAKALLEKILALRLRSGEMEEAILKWEQLVATYESVAADLLSDQVKSTILTSAAPNALKLNLRLYSQETTTYKQIRDLLLGYEQSTRLWGGGGNAGGGGGAMEIDALQGGGHHKQQQCRFYKRGSCKLGDNCKFLHGDVQMKDGGKGNKKGGKKGQGKGSGGGKNWWDKGGNKFKDKKSVECYKCGKTGHYAKECKGGGKGGVRALQGKGVQGWYKLPDGYTLTPTATSSASSAAASSTASTTRLPPGSLHVIDGETWLHVLAEHDDEDDEDEDEDEYQYIYNIDDNIDEDEMNDDEKSCRRCRDEDDDDEDDGMEHEEQGATEVATQHCKLHDASWLNKYFIAAANTLLLLHYSMGSFGLPGWLKKAYKRAHAKPRSQALQQALAWVLLEPQYFDDDLLSGRTMWNHVDLDGHAEEGEAEGLYYCMTRKRKTTSKMRRLQKRAMMRKTTTTVDGSDDVNDATLVFSVGPNNDQPMAMATMLVDSGAFVAAAGPSFAPHIPLKESPTVVAHVANGQTMTHLGVKNVGIRLRTKTGEYRRFNFRFEIFQELRRTIVNIDELSAAGWEVRLGRRNYMSFYDDDHEVVDLTKRGRCPHLPYIFDGDGDINATSDETLMEDDLTPEEMPRMDDVADRMRDTITPTLEDKMTKEITRPKQPAPNLRRVHDLTHTPYASWCDVCVQARAAADKHSSSMTTKLNKAGAGDDEGQHVFQFDYMFMWSADRPDVKATVLSGYHTRSGMSMAVVLPDGKKTTGFAIEMIANFVRECRIPARLQVLQHDGEASLKAIVEAASSRCGGQVRETAKGDSQANGAVEALHRRVQGVARAIKLSLEQKTGMKLCVSDQLFSWIIRHSAWTLNRFQRRTVSGLTPLETISGESYKTALAQFGEKILGKTMGEVAKADPLWQEGIFLGRSAASDAALLGTKDGVIEVRSIKATSGGAVFDSELIKNFRGSPWDLKNKVEENPQQNRMFEWRMPKTPGCTGCHAHGHGHKHSVACKKRKVEWMHTQSHSAPSALTTMPNHAAASPTNDAAAADAASAATTATTTSAAAAATTATTSAAAAAGDDAMTATTATATSTATAMEATDTTRVVRRRLTGKQCVPATQGPNGSTSSASTGQLGFRGQEVASSTTMTTTTTDDVVMSVDDLRTRIEKTPLFKRHDDVESDGSDVDKLRGVIASVGSGATPTDEVGRAELDRLVRLYQSIAAQRHEVLPSFSEEGHQLDGKKAAIGRARELAHLDHFKVFRRVLPDSSMVRRPLSARWVEKEKGAEIRSRLVVREFAQNDHRSDTFAATPEPYSVGVLLAYGALSRWSVGLGDVSVAFMHAPIPRQEGSEPVVINPPADCKEDPREFWELASAMNGLRAAPKMFQDWFAGVVTSKEGGFVRSVADPQLFFSPDRKVFISSHVDDPLILGEKDRVAQALQFLEKKMLFRSEGIKNVDDEFKYLGRVFSKTEGGFVRRTTKKYVDDLLDFAGLSKCRPVSTPGVDDKTMTTGDDVARAGANERRLDDGDATKYRQIVGKLMWLACDRADIQYSVKELAREVAESTDLSMMKAQRVLRYLKKYPTYEQRFAPEEWPKVITVDVDANWAGCRRTRRSTSSAHIKIGNTLIKAISRTQATVALSSGEAEFQAICLGVAEGLWFQAMIEEVLGIKMKVVVRTDSTAAMGIATRAGPGRIKHLDLKSLFVQEVVAQGKVKIEKVGTKVNTSDLGTKHLTAERMRELLELLQIKVDAVVDDDDGDEMTSSSAPPPTTKTSTTTKKVVRYRKDG